MWNNAYYTIRQHDNVPDWSIAYILGYSYLHLILSWASGRGLLEVNWGWTDAASAGDQEEVY